MKKSKLVKDETKSTIQINRSRVSGKKRQDLFARFRNTEHPLDEMFPAETELASSTSTPTTTPTSTRPSTEFPIAPTNNFQKVTNTITREAIPQRLFRTGKTKEIYDVLYSLTRGAVVPRRSISISKPKLRQLTGVGSRITLDACLGYLQIVNLVVITKNSSGQHEGNEYEIFTPEEIGSSTPASTPARHAQTLGVVPRLDTRRGTTGQRPMNTGVPSSPKTSFKDNEKNDDEALTGFVAAMHEVSCKLTKKGLNKNDQGKWKELAELLVMELEIAAARTNSVSNVPAFLTEHLRRRLVRKSSNVVTHENKLKSKEKGTSRSLEVGKAGESNSSEKDDYEAEPLSEEGRATVRETMQGYIDQGQREYVISLEETYTAGDWEWLMENLERVR